MKRFALIITLPIIFFSFSACQTEEKSGNEKNESLQQTDSEKAGEDETVNKDQSEPDSVKQQDSSIKVQRSTVPKSGTVNVMEQSEKDEPSDTLFVAPNHMGDQQELIDSLKKQRMEEKRKSQD